MAVWIRIAAVATAAVALTACHKRPDADPVAAAQGLLSAVQKGDAQAFEAHLDRPAIRANLRQQMTRMARSEGLDLGGPADPALDRMIGMEKLEVVQAKSGAPLAAPPSKAQVAPLMKHLGGARACLHDLSPDQRCLLTFEREKPGWKLVAMPPAELTIALPAEPRKQG
jgi:hypothetical protein